MKKLLFLSAIFTLSFAQMSAQSEKGMFFSLNGGYNFASGSQNVGYKSTRSQFGTNPSIRTEEVVKGSFGKGINVGVAIGYMFNKNIGTELGVNYLIGGEVASNSSDVSNNAVVNFSETTTEKTSAKSIQFRPTFILTAGMSKINPYTKFGLLIAKNSLESKTTENTTSSNTFGGNTTTTVTNVDITRKLDGGLALGFHAALGLSFVVNNHISVFGEVNMVNLSYAPSNGTVTAATANGVNVLPLLDVSDSTAEFVDSVSSSDNLLPTQPTKEVKTYTPFGSFGINFGLKYSL